MDFNETSKVVDIKMRLRELGLSYQGTKAQCLKRLREHMKQTEALPPTPSTTAEPSTQFTEAGPSTPSNSQLNGDNEENESVLGVAFIDFKN